jgi:hypothetical protein
MAASLTEHLQMQGSQMERLNRLYDRYAPRRAKQESTLARQQSELQRAQAPTTFDQSQAARLLREVEQTRQKMASDFLETRADALKVLTSVQRSQLEFLANDTRTRMRNDSYYQLLVAPLDEAWPMDNSVLAPYRGYPANGRDERNNPSGRYGVYGGYGYGQPQYGVYGSVGQGPVGIYGGVGRGGPSIGIGIGGIFGLGRYLR